MIPVSVPDNAPSSPDSFPSTLRDLPGFEVDHLVEQNTKQLDGLMITPMRHGKVMNLQLVSGARIDFDATGQARTAISEPEVAKETAEQALDKLHTTWQGTPKEAYTYDRRRCDFWSFVRETDGQAKTFYVTEIRDDQLKRNHPGYLGVEALVSDTEPLVLQQYREMRAKRVPGRPPIASNGSVPNRSEEIIVVRPPTRRERAGKWIADQATRGLLPHRRI